jgi:hypothetical protein
MEQDTTLEINILVQRSLTGEHDRRRRDDQDSQRVADVRPGRGRDSDSIEISKETCADLQTSTTYGFTKIANYIEDSVKTYDLE